MSRKDRYRDEHAPQAPTFRELTPNERRLALQLGLGKTALVRNAPCFDEQSLRADIIKTWGPAGAHVDVFDMMLKRIKSLEAFKRTVDEAVNSGDGSYRP